MLPKELEQHIDVITVNYTKDKNQKHLLAAKDFFFSRTGTVHDEDEDYEARMNTFYDWYIFQFHSPYIKKTIIQEYIDKNELEEDLVKAFLTPNYSLFEFCKYNFRKNLVLFDIIHDEKFTIAKEYSQVGLVEKDLFIGHIITYKKQCYLLSGITAIPHEIKPQLSKHAKVVRKSSRIEDEKDFLLQIQFFRNKMKRYPHVPAKDIFQFECV